MLKVEEVTNVFLCCAWFDLESKGFLETVCCGCNNEESESIFVLASSRTFRVWL